MKKKVFNLAGKSIEYEEWMLDQNEVLEAAKKFFGYEVTTYPCILSMDSAWNEYELGWCFDCLPQKKYQVGFLGFKTGFKGQKMRSVLPINGKTFMGFTIALKKGKLTVI